jgi:hypothetical protein
MGGSRLLSMNSLRPADGLSGQKILPGPSVIAISAQCPLGN